MTPLRYAYGIVRAADAPAVEAAGLNGIEDGPVSAVVEGELAAACGDVDAERFAAGPLNERVRDLDWLAPRAAAHQDVNARLLELCGTVLPLAFGAIYRDDERVREMLREDAAARVARLASLEGRAEWVFTLVRDAELALDDEDVRALDADIGASAPGRAFLLEKRRGAVVASSLERRDREAAELALAEIGPYAERTYREPIAQDGPDAVVLRASLLVPRDREAGLAAAIAKTGRTLADRGYRVRASGPWPAYRFGGLP